MSVSLDYNGNKSFRLLSIYERLNKGEVLNKVGLAADYGVGEKTVQRDIDDLRAFLAEEHQFESEVAIKYDRTKQGYYLVRFEREWLTNDEVLALCKILLESRAFEKGELNQLISKLLAQVVPNDRKIVDSIIRSELACYVPLRHEKKLLPSLWQLSQAIAGNTALQFSYIRQDGVERTHCVKPVAVLFSEFYFYLIAFMADDTKEYPTVFRIDRMSKIAENGETFTIPYNKKFSDGEFRKRIQFMYSGELRVVNFEYSGASIESVLDRLPTSEIVSEKNGVYTIRAEVYGDGIDMWLKSQGDMVKVL